MWTAVGPPGVAGERRQTSPPLTPTISGCMEVRMIVTDCPTNDQLIIVKIHRDEIANEPRKALAYRLACIFLKPMFDPNALPAWFIFHATSEQFKEYDSHITLAFHDRDWLARVDAGDGMDAFGNKVNVYPDDDPTSRGIPDPHPRKPGELKELLATAKHNQRQARRAFNALMPDSDVIRAGDDK